VHAGVVVWLRVCVCVCGAWGVRGGGWWGMQSGLPMHVRGRTIVHIVCRVGRCFFTHVTAPPCPSLDLASPSLTPLPPPHLPRRDPEDDSDGSSESGRFRDPSLAPPPHPRIAPRLPELEGGEGDQDRSGDRSRGSRDPGSGSEEGPSPPRRGSGGPRRASGRGTAGSEDEGQGSGSGSDSDSGSVADAPAAPLALQDGPRSGSSRAVAGRAGGSTPPPRGGSSPTLLEVQAHGASGDRKPGYRWVSLSMYVCVYIPWHP
jgi:hypothetical protein